MDEPWRADIDDFCARLRQLRAESGNPTLEWLSKHPLCPRKSQLSNIFRGQIRHLPDADTVAGIVERCTQWAQRHNRRPLLPLDERHWLIERDLVERRIETARATERKASDPERIVPFQLPFDTARFTGRTEHLARLLSLGAGPGRRNTVSITVVEGMAGIGKTALAVHAAHRLADEYPDGVLFTDLHGFTPDAEPDPPEQVLDRLLRGLGVPGPQIPPDLEARAALYRSILARRRVLVVLDNAAHETQLQPLLPGTPDCAVIVTSRQHLAGLDDATHLALPVLDPVEAAALFRGLTDDRAIPVDQLVVDRIVTVCGHLPLAIRIAAARLRLGAATPAELCAELEHALATGHGLDWLSDGHRAVAATLAVSFQHLAPGQQAVLRLIGLHPGADLEPYAVAALADVTVAEAGKLLEQLHAASLLDQPGHHRYRRHDLVAVYTKGLAAALPESEQCGALDRLYDHYAATSSTAMRLTHPWEAGRLPDPPASRAAVPHLPDREHARTWLDSELDNLLATAHHAAVRRADHTVHQSATLHWHLRGHGHYAQAALLHRQVVEHARDTANHAAEQAALTCLGHISRLQGEAAAAIDWLEQALTSARRTGDPTGEQDALNGLGDVHCVQGQSESAADYYEKALAIATTADDRAAEQDALNGLGYVRCLQGRYGSAADYYEQALAVARDIGHRVGEQHALNGLAHSHYLQGRIAPATDYYEQALASARETGHRTATQSALRGLGGIHYLQGRYESATDYYEQALAIAAGSGDSTGEWYALRGLGDVYVSQGRYQQATDTYEQILVIARRTGDRNADFEAHQGLGRIHYRTHRYRDALRHHQAALRLAVDLDQPADQARAEDGLSHAHLALGDPDRARHHWLAALDLLTGIGTDHTEEPDVTTEAIRARLSELDSRQTGSPAG